MSSDTFTTAMFLITAVIAAGVLINPVFPVVFQMASTFSSATHSSDVRLRTDFVIVTTFANPGSGIGQIYMKNIGSQSISVSEIKSSDVFFGLTGTYKRLDYTGTVSDGTWKYTLHDLNTPPNNYWDPGETLEIDAGNSDINAQNIAAQGGMVYFQFILPNGVWRSTQFTASNI